MFNLDFIALLAVALAMIGHAGDVWSTVRNFRFGMDEDNAAMAALIEWSGGPYAYWRWIKLHGGTGLSLAIYFSCAGDPVTVALGILLNAWWSGFLASTAFRNYLAGNSYRKRHPLGLK